jgi:hypothetical protein
LPRRWRPPVGADIEAAAANLDRAGIEVLEVIDAAE